MRGVEVVFSEKEPNVSKEKLEKLSKNPLENDANFISAIEKIRPELSCVNPSSHSLQNRPVVLGCLFSNHNEQNNERDQHPNSAPNLPQPLIISIDFLTLKVMLPIYRHYKFALF